MTEHTVTKWTVKALTRQTVAELDKTYDLVYVNYDDKFTDNQVAMLVRGDTEALWDDTNEWEGDQRYDNSTEEAKQLAKAIAQRWERTFDVDSDDLYDKWEADDEEVDVVRYTIQDRDTSDWPKQLASHSGYVLMRQVIVDEDHAWGYESPTPTDVVKRFLEEAEPGTVFKRNAHNLKVVRATLNEASPEYGYVMGMIVYAVRVSDLYDLPSDGYVDVINPHLYLGNYGMGDGYCEGPLDATFRVRRDDLRTDRDAPGYGWDEVAGVVTSAYEAEIRVVPKEEAEPPFDADRLITVSKHTDDEGHAFGNDYVIDECWRVLNDGEVTNLRVVRGRSPVPYLTVVNEAGAMQTSWHLGAEPVDLARTVMNRHKDNA